MATIRKRGKGYQIDYFDPTGKRIRQSFKKRKHAEAELGKRVSLIAENRYLDVKKDYRTTLGELLDRYKENYLQQASFDRTKRFWLANFREHFGKDTLLANIKYLDIETYRNHLRQKPAKGRMRTDAAINRELSCLRHLFNKAVEWEMIEASPFSRGRKLHVRENNKRLRFLSEGEIQALLTECPNHIRRIVECAIHTGMRRGEILSLKWDQIRNGQVYLHKTKTNEARQVPINPDLDRLFKEIRRGQELRSEYVFTFWNGEHNLKGERPVRSRRTTPVSPKAVASIKTAFNAACRRAGIEDFRFHDLRHTFASHMVMRGASLKEVQEILGHHSLTMTTRYAHLSQEHKKQAVNLLNGLTAPKTPTVDTCHKTVTSLKPASSPAP